MGTFKRDYLGDTDLRDAESVLAQLGGWFDDYNTQAPHSAFGMRSPRDYRALILTSAFGAGGDVPGIAAFAPGRAIDRRVAIWVPPENRDGAGPVRAANLSSPPVQQNGEHSKWL